MPAIQKFRASYCGFVFDPMVEKIIRSQKPHKQIDGFSYDDIADFLAQHYVVRNADDILGVCRVFRISVGDIEPESQFGKSGAGWLCRVGVRTELKGKG